MQSQEQQAHTPSPPTSCLLLFVLAAIHVVSGQAVAVIQKLCCLKYVQLCSYALWRPFSRFFQIFGAMPFSRLSLGPGRACLAQGLHAKLDQFLGLFLGFLHAGTGFKQVLLDDFQFVLSSFFKDFLGQSQLLAKARKHFLLLLAALLAEVGAFLYLFQGFFKIVMGAAEQIPGFLDFFQSRFQGPHLPVPWLCPCLWLCLSLFPCLFQGPCQQHLCLFQGPPA